MAHWLEWGFPSAKAIQNATNRLYSLWVESISAIPDVASGIWVELINRCSNNTLAIFVREWN
jgi:hypothetical protein